MEWLAKEYRSKCGEYLVELFEDMWDADWKDNHTRECEIIGRFSTKEEAFAACVAHSQGKEGE